MSNNQTVDLRGSSTSTSFATATISTLTYYSLHHLRAAAKFARLSAEVEKSYSGQFDDELFSDHRGYVTGSVVTAVSFLEATINELFSDAMEGTSEQVKQLDADTLTLMTNIWKLPKTESFSILDKYQLALSLARKEPFEKGKLPYQHVQLLINLRNTLVHYKPGWVSKDKGLHKWEGQLQAVGFSLNPMMPHNPFFPDQCISHGCAKWAVICSLGFARDFYSRMGLTPLFDTVSSNVRTE